MRFVPQRRSEDDEADREEDVAGQRSPQTVFELDGLAEGLLGLDVSVHDVVAQGAG